MAKPKTRGFRSHRELLEYMGLASQPRRKPRAEPKLWNDGPTRVHTTKSAEDIENLNRGLNSFVAPKVDDQKRGAMSPLGGQAVDKPAGFKDAWKRDAQALRKFEGR
jgi:hypothetical protein